ncbi:MAG: ATP-binding protein [Prevotellaceae bacterium]|jgi:AAA+ ATPase superfamily predicted ATPase|nr:ATP-binding protein [Prevotellaceae bacterium]
MNPFSYGAAVKGENFYDRKEDCKRIVDTLAGGNNLVLYAPRRFGKTSLVFRAIEQLERQNFICVYFDFMPVFSPESFVRLYAKALAAKQSNLQKFAKTFVSIVKSIRPVLGFGQDGTPEFSIDFASSTVDEAVVSQLLDLPELMAKSSKRVLVFFDEFQEVEKLKGIYFEGLLRSKIQQQRRVSYLFFGSKTHLMQAMFNDKKRAFYNAASQMTISYLPEKDTVAFLQQNFAKKGIRLDEEMAQYIISATANIPHYIQLLAAEIWQAAESSASITHEAVNKSILQVLALKGDYYMELFDRQSNSKKQLLLALCRDGKNIFSEAYIRANNLPNSATLQRAVTGLTSDGIIDKTGREYFISDPFFKLFLKDFSL